MFNNEKVVESKVCRQCQTKFDITNKDIEFYEKISPIFKIPHPSPLLTGDGKEKSFSIKEKDLGGGLKEIKYLIPIPTLCPDCRQQRRLAFRNERKLYKRTCDATGKPIISIYSPDKLYKVYNQEFWWSDKWDALKYGKEFDFSKSFFEQYEKLYVSVPKISLYGNNNENSLFGNDTTNNKNCYLIFASDFNESCFYGVFNNSVDSMDSLESKNINNSYECFNCSNGTKLFYSIDSNNCTNSSFLINCDNCEYCYLSHNLINKKYYFLNKQYSKEEYFNLISKLPIFDAKKMFAEVREKTIYKNLKISNSENCYGNYIKNSKDCKYCFDVSDGNNCKYVYFGSQKLSDCMDTIMASINASKCYEVQTCLENCYNIIGCNFCNNIQNTYYSDSCINCSNCFGCVGFRNKSYCILNKQYTKDEYEELVPKIIEHMQKTGEWGEFFPSSISPFGYNETVANEYFQLNSDDILNCHSELVSESSKGIKSLFNDSGLNPEGGNTFIHGPIFNRSTYEQAFPKVDKIIIASKLPKDIKEIPDDILNRAIECEITKKPFRIISQELEFYRKHNLPIPRRHPDQRHLDRMSLRNPRKLYDRKCDKCKKDIKTTYSPEKQEIVYCEDCYNKEIY
ncbi:MAG: hypothetical protein PHN31_02240 [Candidatus Gracilibacteria bacterium]|nr:hypothetical protein [Candidatus Gracilibacteria bacterium]